jgi:phosphomethylpyrimidine synthase
MSRLFSVKWEAQELERVAVAEGTSVEQLRGLLDSGRVVIPRNTKRAEATGNRAIVLKAIGEGMSTKVNVNVGTSKDYVNLDEEAEKATVAVRYGADTIMDLSTGGDLDETRRRILNEVNVPVGTVPIYQAALGKLDERAVVDMTSDDMFNAVRKNAIDGIDFVTIHAGVNRNALERLKRSGRILDVVSRGGAFLVAARIRFMLNTSISWSLRRSTS